MNPSAGVYTPPRPNLGPEPLDSPSLPMSWLVVGSIFLIATAFGIHRVVRRIGRKDRPKATKSSEIVPHSAESARKNPLLDLVTQVRDSLTCEFGDGIRARTTEELAVDPRLAEALGAESHSDLLAFLEATDVARFAGSDRGDAQGFFDDWSVWAADFVEAAGARSTISGK